MARGTLITLTILYFLLSSCNSPKNNSTIEIFETDSGIVINYALGQPRAFIEFTEPGYRNPSAKIQTPDGKITDGVLKFENPKSNFQLSIELDVEEENSIYPLLTEISQNTYVLYAPPVLPNGRVSSIVYTALSGTQTKFERSHNFNGYLLLGSISATSERFDWLKGVSLPKEFEQNLFSFTDEILTYYSEQMSSVPDQKPLIIVLGKPSEKSFNRGDTTQNGVVFLRYHFPDNYRPTKKYISNSKDFIAHELFHLWTPKAAEQSSNWWIHEGAAEYASWHATSKLSEPEITIEKKLERAYNNCSNMLRHLSMKDAIGSIKSRSRYTCGAFMNWIAIRDFQIKNEDHTEFDLWRQLWEAPEEEIELSSKFNSIIKSSNLNALSSIETIVSGQGTSRWDEILAQFEKQGAEFDKITPSTFSLQIAATQAIVLSACGEFFGVGVDQKNRLYAVSSCDPFKSSPIIKSLDGIDPVNETNEYIDYTIDACGKNKEITLILLVEEKETTYVQNCSTPVQLPPTQIKLNKL